MKRVTVALNETLHRRLKAEAALRGCGVMEALEQAVEALLADWAKEQGNAQ